MCKLSLMVKKIQRTKNPKVILNHCTITTLIVSYSTQFLVGTIASGLFFYFPSDSISDSA